MLNIEYFYVCTNFEFKVKVPLKFLGMVGFSVSREGRLQDINSFVRKIGEFDAFRTVQMAVLFDEVLLI